MTKTYSDMTVFQVPPNLPFTVGSVGSGADYLKIAGRDEWGTGGEPRGLATGTKPASPGGGDE